MNFNKKLLYIFFFTISFIQFSHSKIDRLDIRKENLSNNIVLAETQFAKAALIKAGISETLTNEPFSKGGYGKVFYTQNYAIKISSAEYSSRLNGYESSRLLNIKNQFQQNPPVGFNICLPEYIYKIYVDGQDNIRTTNGYGSANVQIMPRIRAQASMAQLAINCYKSIDSKTQEIMRCFGEKMGDFQNWGLIQKPGNAPDLTCKHGDFNPNNILVTSTNDQGSAAEITLIDNADFSNPKTSINGGCSLVSDLTYFTYKYTNYFLDRKYPNWENTLETTLRSFYTGYIPRLPKEVCQKLISNFYGNVNRCLQQTQLDIRYKIRHLNGSQKIPNLQNRAFLAAYKSTYPAEIGQKPQPNHQHVLHHNPALQPLFHQPAPNKAAQKRQLHQQKANQKAIARAQKARQKAAARAQRAAQKAAVRAQKAAAKNRKRR